MESDRFRRLLPIRPTTDGEVESITNSSVSPDFANLESVRRWPVDDFWKVSSSGAVKAVVRAGGWGLLWLCEC